MDPYQVFIAEDVVEVISTLRSHEKGALREFISGLAFNPDRLGDFPERDRSGRETQCKIIGDYALCFYPDHAVREIKVFEINRADRL
ncbi:MAG: hypothetical protein JJT96_20990 [Opitutales bacterium]|nr:hypothetical protein [Opitutales bacterium]